MRESWFQVVRLFRYNAHADLEGDAYDDGHFVARADAYADAQENAHDNAHSDTYDNAHADTYDNAHHKAQGRILRRDVISESGLRAQIEVVLMVLLLGVGLVLSIASSRKPGASKSPKNGPVLSEKASELGHPAFVVMNTTSCQIKIALKGKTDRNLLLIPMGAFRTLIAAGRYVMIIQNEDACRIGVDERVGLDLERGRRYFLRLPPSDED